MATILVVEDDPDLRGAMRDVLELAGHVVVTAAHGAEALRVLEGLDVNVVVLDLDLPIMDGAEFLQRRMRSSRLSAIPVVVVSAWLDRVATPTATARLLKPVSVDALQAALKKALGAKPLRVVDDG